MSDEQQSLFDPEPEPDYTDTSVWIRVETPELVPLIERNGDDVIRREVLSGKMLVSYRKRTEADGSAAVVIEKPVSKLKPPKDEPITWPGWGTELIHAFCVSTTETRQRMTQVGR